MKIKVSFTRLNKTETLEVDKDSTIIDVLKKFDIKPDFTIILIDNKPVPVDSELEDGQHITLVEVSSGG